MQTVIDPNSINCISKMKPDLRVGIVCLADIWEGLPPEIIIRSWARASIMPSEGISGEETHAEFTVQLASDSAEMRLLNDAIPGGDPDLDPYEYIMDSSELPAVGATAVDFLMTDDPEAGDEDSPNADLSSISSSGSSSSNTAPNYAQSDSGPHGEASLSSTATEEINTGVPVSMWLESLTLAKRTFEEHNRQYDVRFVYQLNRMISAVAATQAGVAIRAARHQADIRSYFSP